MTEPNDVESRDGQTASDALVRNQTNVEIVLKTMSTWFLIAGIFLLLIGGLTIMFPLFTAMAIEGVIGAAFLFAGVAHAFHAFQSRQWEGRVSAFLLAAIFIAGGAVLFASPVAGIQSIALVIGMVIFVESVCKLLFYRKLQLPNPVLWIADGCIGIVLAILIFAGWPQDAAWVIGMLIGVRIGFTGVILIAASKKLKKSFVLNPQQVELTFGDRTQFH